MIFRCQRIIEPSPTSSAPSFLPTAIPTSALSSTSAPDNAPESFQTNSNEEPATVKPTEYIVEDAEEQVSYDHTFFFIFFLNEEFMLISGMPRFNW